jgi:dethiobiotin synthetase
VRGCFVTGTDTGAGKTVVAGAIVAALRARGIAVRARKPLITGLDDPAPADWPHDHELLARAAGCSPDEVAVRTFGPAVSPHLALELAGEDVDAPALVAALRASAGDDEVLIVEGVGGLLVPISPECSVRDLAGELELPLVIAARAGLGTINHTLLTLEAARAASLFIAGVVLSPWPEVPSAMERSNRETIERIGGVPVGTLPWIRSGAPALLAAAGEPLPLNSWLGLGERALTSRACATA